MSPIIEKFSDTAALVAGAGDRLVDAITSAIDTRGSAHIVLTGGGTGIGLLKRVGERGENIDWSKVHLYWGDDRFVPEDDDERNYKQAREAVAAGKGMGFTGVDDPYEAPAKPEIVIDNAKMTIEEGVAAILAYLEKQSII